MADFLILRKIADNRYESVAQILGKQTSDVEGALKEGFAGPGDYAVVRWDNRREFEAQNGPPILVPKVAP